MRASEALDYGRRSKERSTRSQYHGSEEKDASQKLKITLIRLIRTHQTWKSSRLSRS